MATPFPFAQYFGDINILAALQYAPGAKDFVDRSPVDPPAKDLRLDLGCNVLRTARTSFVARHPDVYKEYKKRGDPEAVFEAVREYVEAHRLDPARVRAVLNTAFTPACAAEPANPS